MDLINLLAMYLSNRKFLIRRHEPDKLHEYPWLVIKQKDRKGWVQVKEVKQGIQLRYCYNGHQRGEQFIDIADPESLPQMMQFLRTMFRVYGK